MKPNSHTRKNKPLLRKNKPLLRKNTPPSRKPLRKSITKHDRKNSKYDRKNSKYDRKNSKYDRKNSKHANRRHSNTDNLTRRNWMKKLLFTGGDASHQAESVYGGIGQQHAISHNNNAIYQNPFTLHGSSVSSDVAPV